MVKRTFEAELGKTIAAADARKLLCLKNFNSRHPGTILKN